MSLFGKDTIEERYADDDDASLKALMEKAQANAKDYEAGPPAVVVVEEIDTDDLSPDEMAAYIEMLPKFDGATEDNDASLDNVILHK